jgi:hypothetical protein
VQRKISGQAHRSPQETLPRLLGQIAEIDLDPRRLLRKLMTIRGEAANGWPR